VSIKRTLYAGVVSGAGTALVANSFARYVEIQEDGSGTAVGLVYTDQNGTVTNYPPSQQPIKIGNPAGGLGGATGPLLGVPANYNGGGGAATSFGSVKSMSGTTAVRVSEYS
jgi:hypothetical protein